MRSSPIPLTNIDGLADLRAHRALFGEFGNKARQIKPERLRFGTRLAPALFCAAALLAAALPAQARTISDAEARGHAGESATVCGTVASVYYARRSRARPTFLDFGTVYPRETFTAVIFGADRRSFGDLAIFPGTRLCVTGLIDLYRGRPEIILRERGQLRAVN